MTKAIEATRELINILKKQIEDARNGINLWKCDGDVEGTIAYWEKKIQQHELLIARATSRN